MVSAKTIHKAFRIHKTLFFKQNPLIREPPNIKHAQRIEFNATLSMFFVFQKPSPPQVKPISIDEHQPKLPKPPVVDPKRAGSGKRRARPKLLSAISQDGQPSKKHINSKILPDLCNYTALNRLICQYFSNTFNVHV